MITWHYALSDPDAVVSKGTIDVDHICCLDHRRFTKEDCATLDEVFRTLPGYDAENSEGWLEGRLRCSAVPPPGFRFLAICLLKTGAAGMSNASRR
jgi:hypothetical protein